MRLRSPTYPEMTAHLAELNCRWPEHATIVEITDTNGRVQRPQSRETVGPLRPELLALLPAR